MWEKEKKKISFDEASLNEIFWTNVKYAHHGSLFFCFMCKTNDITQIILGRKKGYNMIITIPF